MHEEYAKKNFFGYQIVVNIPYTWVGRWWDKITKPSWCSEVSGEFSFWRSKKYSGWGYSSHDEGFMTRMLNLMTAFLSAVTRLSADPGRMLDTARYSTMTFDRAHTVISLTFSETSPPPRSDEEIQLRSHATHTPGKIIFFCWSVALCACELYRLLQSNASSSVELSCAFIDILWCSSWAQWNSMDITYNSHKGIAIVIHFALWLFLCFHVNSLVSLALHKLSGP